jgi:hypothetical protein
VIPAAQLGNRVGFRFKREETWNGSLRSVEVAISILDSLLRSRTV